MNSQDLNLQSELNDYINGLEGFPKWEITKQIHYFSYFLTSIGGLKSFTAKQIDWCFSEARLPNYRRLPQYLSESSKGKAAVFIKQKYGYILERSKNIEIEGIVNGDPQKQPVSMQLAELLENIHDKSEKSFLKESIDCYSVKAYRAAIVLTWSMTISHLINYIVSKKLVEFNLALTKYPDKKLSQSVMKVYDDFSELKESQLIELASSAKVITSDIKKLLNEKLGVRNSAAHPSSIKFSGNKATEFIIDLIDNVILKYST